MNKLPIVTYNLGDIKSDWNLSNWILNSQINRVNDGINKITLFALFSDCISMQSSDVIRTQVDADEYSLDVKHLFATV